MLKNQDIINIKTTQDTMERGKILTIYPNKTCILEPVDTLTFQYGIYKGQEFINVSTTQCIKE